MAETKKPYRLLAPGPVPVPPAVLRLMSEKVLHHRTPTFEKILTQCWEGLQTVFGTQQPVQILAGTGSAAMEAAVVNLLSPGDEALVIVSGKFGERWADICERHQVVTHRWNVDWGKPAPPNSLREQLRKFPNVKMVYTQACETSTATLHNVLELTQVVHSESSAMIAVDAITAIGCLWMPMDEWNIDVMIAGSQKAFMIPTGLSFIALSERAWEAQGQARLPKYYFDLAAEKKANARSETFFSTPTQLLMGLSAVLNRMQQTGVERTIQRCELLAGITRIYGERLGFTLFSESPSPSVTALRVPDEVDSGKLRDELETRHNITIMGGQDQLKGKILRVGHMGDVRNEDMVALFDALAQQMELLTGAKRTLDFNAMKSEIETYLSTVEPLFP